MDIKKIGFLLLVCLMILAVSGCTNETVSNATNTSQSLTGDAAWLYSVDTHSKTLSSDVNELSTATNNQDSQKILAAATKLQTDAESSLTESKNMKVSPQLQNSKADWEKALSQYASSAQRITEGVSNRDDHKIQTGIQSMHTATSYLERSLQGINAAK